MNGSVCRSEQLRLAQQFRMAVDQRELLDAEHDRGARVEALLRRQWAERELYDALDQGKIAFGPNQSARGVVGHVVEAEQLVQGVDRRRRIVDRLVGRAENLPVRIPRSAVVAVGRDGDAAGSGDEDRPVDAHEFLRCFLWWRP